MSLPPVVMRKVMRELSELKKSPPEGIRVVTSDDNMLDVTGIIEGPEGTPYFGGYFKVNFRFTEEFPAAPPKCWFATKIFHPNVSSSGEICVNTLKKDWKSSYGIGHILITVKCLLIYPNPESALDEEAGKLLLENYDSYCQRAKLITSVHATPRVKPIEFETVADSSSSSTKTTTGPSPVPNVPFMPPLSSSSTLLPNPIFSFSTFPAESKPPPPSPLKSSTSNTSLSLSPSDKEGKERHTSPSPLGTADANVGSGGGKMGSGIVPGTNGTTETNTNPPTKAVKRAATGSASTGAEKRKKALKRL